MAFVDNEFIVMTDANREIRLLDFRTEKVGPPLTLAAAQRQC
jgi:hypothetical protein